MVNQKEQAKRVEQAEGQVLKAEAGVPQPVADPLAELLGRAQSAYAAYVEARKEVARA